jgi:hypothetical protein
VFDAARGTSAIVSQISGGNGALKADDRHVVKVGLTVKPLTRLNLTVTANYINSRTRNAIVSLSGASAAMEAAFPDRFTRDADGNLTGIDTRALNIARQDREELRWGLNFTAVLRAPHRPAPPPGFA